MGISNRSFTYKTRIKVSNSDYDLALSGKKTCTIRLGTLAVGRDILDLTDGSRSVKIRVLRIDSGRRYADLTDEEAIQDGQASKQALDLDLRKFYGKIDPNQPMTLIFFELIKS